MAIICSGASFISTIIGLVAHLLCTTDQYGLSLDNRTKLSYWMCFDLCSHCLKQCHWLQVKLNKLIGFIKIQSIKMHKSLCIRNVYRFFTRMKISIEFKNQQIWTSKWWKWKKPFTELSIFGRKNRENRKEINSCANSHMQRVTFAVAQCWFP